MRILVVGSINRDTIITVERAPDDGETVHSCGSQYCPGGKGANQATACDGEVAMVGCVGNDEHGREMLQTLLSAKVDTRYIAMTSQASTGSAFITVDANGQNRIIVQRNANSYVTREMVAVALENPWDVVMLQWELPIDVVMASVEMAAAHGIDVIMDPAPALPLLHVEIPNGVTVFTPNEHETQVLTGFSIHEQPEQALAVMAKIAPIVLVKMGEHGAILHHDGRAKHFPAHPANVIDTTGAGDVFTAAFASKYKHGLDEAVDYANQQAAAYISKKRM